MKIDRQAIYNKYGGRCAYCGIKVKYKDFQVDHINPKYWNGTNDPENLNPSCRSCNILKSSYHIEQFRGIVEGLVAVMRRYHSNYRIMERYGIVRQIKSEIKFYYEEVSRETGSMEKMLIESEEAIISNYVNHAIKVINSGGLDHLEGEE